MRHDPNQTIVALSSAAGPAARAIVRLSGAEAVRAVIEAGSRDELQQALAQLAGGVALPLQELRGDLLDLLADVEAALDFSDEDIHFVAEGDLLRRLTRGLALLTNLRHQ